MLVCLVVDHLKTVNLSTSKLKTQREEKQMIEIIFSLRLQRPSKRPCCQPLYGACEQHRLRGAFMVGMLRLQRAEELAM